MNNIRIEPSWKKVLGSEFTETYFEEPAKFVRSEYSQAMRGGKQIYPAAASIFKAFEACPFEEVKVVILGQDPYHGVGQANGLCFSVDPEVVLPPSLQNIFKEIESDLGVEIERSRNVSKLADKKSGDLLRWAKQGVLLLNSTLTVEAGRAGSHQGKGWEKFTDRVIEVLSTQRKGLVFLLWGRYAQEKGAIIDDSIHLVLKAAHPSPLSAYSGFFGCKHFSKANEYLVSAGVRPIDWR